MRTEFLRVTGAGKTENGLELLRDISLTLYAQEIAFIAGASILEMNGLVRLLTGRDNFDCGTVFFREKLENRSGSMAFLKDHMTVLTEQDCLIDSISIVDNFFVCVSARQPFFARDRKNRRILQQLLDTFAIEIDLDQPVRSLHLLQRYQLQLLKLFYHSAGKAVLLDKRKIFLSEEEFLQLYHLMCQLKRHGMTFLVVDYTISSAWEMIDTLAVIRDACTILQTDVAFLTERGKYVLRHEELHTKQEMSRLPNEGETVLQLKNVCTELLHGIDLALQPGEIAAVHYTDYETARELCRVLNGSTQPQQGELWLNGARSTALTQEQRVQEGLTFIEEYMADSYLFDNLTALQNYCMPKGLRFQQLWHNHRYQRYLKKELNALANREVADLRLPELLPREVLRVKFCSQLLARPAVLVCQDPFSSVDQFLRKDVEALLGELAANGTGVILFSRMSRIRKMGQYAQYELTKEGELLEKEH